jgi:cyclic-di-AMP phosphodiesterase PgpH
MKANLALDSRLRLLRADPGQVLALAASFVVLAALIGLTYAGDGGATSLIRPPFELGVAAGYDLVTDREIVYVDMRATLERERQQGEYLVPVFSSRPTTLQENAARYERFMNALRQDRFAGDGGAAALVEDSQLSREELIFFVNRLNGRSVLERFRVMLDEFGRKGVFHLPDDFVARFPKGLIEVARGGAPESVGEMVHVDAVITRANLRDAVRKSIRDETWSYEEIQALLLLASIFIQENVFIDETRTADKRLKMVQKHEPVFRFLPKGFPLLRKGQLVTEDDLARVNVFFSTAAETAPHNLAGRLVYLGVVAGLCLLIFRKPILENPLERNQAIMLAILDTTFLAMAITVHRFLLYLNSVPLGMVLPGALVAVLTTILISPRVALINAAVITLGQLLVMDVQPSSLAFTFFGAAMASNLVRRVERRIELARAGLFLAGIQAVLAIGLGLLDIRDSFMTATSGAWALVNGLLTGPLALGILPLMEHAFNVPTSFRLLELSDVNSPVLKKMLGLAPGTYNHSVSVANLAETACREIGANALLARVGAYYHDIGKIDQSEYFIENQTRYNKHDQLAPGASSAIIKSHVKLGIEQANKLGLPREVVDIIAQHHGNSLIPYFYQRALSGDPAASRSDFSYQGTPPISREAAVVLLADGIEAAARSLKKASVQNLEKLVNRLVDERVRAGQLKNAELSLRDLEIIKITFVKVLTGYYHSRIDYPRLKPREPQERREPVP